MMKNKKGLFKCNIWKIIIVLAIASGIFIAWGIKNIEKNDVVIPTDEEDISDEYVEEKVIDSEKDDSTENQNILKPTQQTSNSETSKSEINVPEQNKPIEQPVEEEKETVDKDDPNFTLAVKSLDLETLKSYKLPMMIDFGSDGCIPCREMAPVLEELNTELKGKAIIKFVDVWKYPEASEGFDFSLIPTQFFFDKDGNMYKSHTGGLTKDEAMAILKELGVE
jgi:thioredoxin 1